VERIACVCGLRPDGCRTSVSFGCSSARFSRDPFILGSISHLSFLVNNGKGGGAWGGGRGSERCAAVNGRRICGSMIHVHRADRCYKINRADRASRAIERFG